MMSHRKSALLFVAALAVAATTENPTAHAGDSAVDGAVELQKAPTKGKKTDKKEAAPAEAPTTTKPISVQPKELTWGIDMKKVGAVYDAIIDEDYKPRYRKVQPGPETERIDAEVAERKAEFRRSLTRFDATATGYDSSTLNGEYSYKNKEALMFIERAGKRRYFFFIADKLWKVIDVIQVGEKSAWGKTFDDAVKLVDKYYGVAGRVREPNPAEDRYLKEVDYKDATNQARIIDWGGDKVGMAFQESATVNNLPNLRKNQRKDAGQIDPSVKDAGRKDDEKPKDKPKK